MPQTLPRVWVCSALDCLTEVDSLVTAWTMNVSGAVGVYVWGHVSPWIAAASVTSLSIAISRSAHLRLSRAAQLNRVNVTAARA